MVTRQTLAGSNSSTVKSHNLRAILLALLKHDYVSRVQLAELTGLSTTTITNLVTELLDQELVVEEGAARLKQQPGAGRPRRALRLVPEARYAVGIHIGVGNIRVAITDLRANILAHHTFTHALDQPAKAVLDETMRLVERAILQEPIPPHKIVGVGVGTSGLVNPATGINLLAPNLNWHDVPIQAWLTERLELPVCMDNNVRAMALGEALFGAAKNVRVVAFVYGRIGVGAGFVVDGQLFRGSSAGAGEIGHMTLIADGGTLCRCGNTGCLETLVSEPQIVRQAQAFFVPNGREPAPSPATEATGLNIEDIFEAARAGNQAILDMLKQPARYLGIALANLVNILNPELILLGGIFAQGQDLLLPTIEETMRARAFANLGQAVRLQPTSFGSNAGVIGGAALALTNFFYQQDGLTTPSPLSEVIA